MDTYGNSITTRSQRRFNASVNALIWAALLFNWVLAAINANVFAISQPMVVVCEMLLLSGALVLTANAGIRREQLYLLCGFAIYLAFTLLRFMIAQQVEPKPVRDMAIIFVFLCLGMAYRNSPYTLVYRVTLVLLVIGLVETVLPDLYSRLFNIKSYYINTRGFTEADFWNANSDLFVSGTRPGARFFLSFTNLPRASSVFLEPVSLGNFIIIGLSTLLAGWRDLSRLRVVVWSIALFALLLISDSRYAFACGMVLIGLRVVLPRFPQQFGFLLFFGVVAAGALLAHWSGATRASDDFTGRIFYTFNALHYFTTDMLLGVRFDLASHYMDSGLAYFIVSQSLLVLVALVMYYSFGVVGANSQARLYKNALMVAWSLSLLISNSLFSIKVAALMWFVLGALISTMQRVEPAAKMRELDIATGALH